VVSLNLAHPVVRIC